MGTNICQNVAMTLKDLVTFTHSLNEGVSIRIVQNFKRHSCSRSRQSFKYSKNQGNYKIHLKNLLYMYIPCD